MTSCSIPRTAAARDIPTDQVGDWQREHLADVGIDIEGCHIRMILHAFNEFEERDFAAGKIGHRFETWPPEIRAHVERCIADFVASKKAVIVAITSAIKADAVGHGCVLALHWRAK